MIIQNVPDNLGRWFYTNAPAAWISAVVALSTLAYVLASRKKPKRIVVREVEKSSLVRIWPSVRDKISMSFNGQPVKNLGQIDLEIFNEGSEVIKLPGVEISLANESIVLDVLLTPFDPEADAQGHANKVVVTLPYLNPYREHKQLVKLSILVDGSTEEVRAAGDGEGWSTRHVSLPNLKQIRRRLLWGMLLSVGAAFYGGFVQAYLARHHSSNFSVLYLPAVVALSGALLILKRSDRLRPRF